jgi:hypothetical protein
MSVHVGPRLMPMNTEMLHGAASYNNNQGNKSKAREQDQTLIAYAKCLMHHEVVDIV